MGQLDKRLAARRAEPKRPSSKGQAGKTALYVPVSKNQKNKATGGSAAAMWETKPAVNKTGRTEQPRKAARIYPSQADAGGTEYDYESMLMYEANGGMADIGGKEGNAIDDSDGKKEKKRVLSRAFIYGKAFRTAASILLSVACIYLIFLIYGVFATKYVYNEQGVIVPQTMTVSEVKEAHEFEKILQQYKACRELYQHVLVLDYRLAQGYEEPMILAPEYSALLKDDNNQNDVTDLSIRINALTVKTGYTTIKDLMYNFAFNDVALYLQYISTAITNNDAESGNMALDAKDVMYTDFSILTQNIIAMGSSIKGVDITDVAQWSPEGYVESYINGD